MQKATPNAYTPPITPLNTPLALLEYPLARLQKIIFYLCVLD